MSSSDTTSTGGSAAGWLGSLPTLRAAGRAVAGRHAQLRPGGSDAPCKREAMETLRAHLEARQLTPVIDRTFPLAEAGAALRYLTEGRPRGRVVLTP